MFTPFRPDIPLIVDPGLESRYESFKDYSMIPRDIFLENCQLIQFFAARVPGDLVECGTWKGGMSCAMMSIGGPSRTYHFFDSFEGLPPVRPIDGPAARTYQQTPESPTYYENCRASYEAFCNLVYSQPVPREHILVHKGWFKDTLSAFPTDEHIAVLRLDADWYESTRQCLDSLYDRVAEGGVIIIDDYDAWDGCSRAVHDFLSQRSSTSRIYRTPVTQVAYVVKYEIPLA